MRKDLAIWLQLCVITGIILTVYLSLAIDLNDGPLVMPLDDTYIHFQYARQLAHGHPFEYNTGEAPTSGATSLIYSPLLALGYLLGFHDLLLGYWALLLGAISFVLSAWLIYRSVQAMGGSPVLSAISMYTFVFNGAFIWAALSGMETMLFILSVLLCLYAYQRNWQQRAAVAGALTALIRPEGAIVAGSLALALAWRAWRTTHTIPWWSSLPIAAILVQPLLNFALTGSFSAAGNQAKSHFYDESAPLSEQLARVGEYWVRMWRELFEGHAKYGDPYIFGLVVIMALIMIALSLRTSWRSRQIAPALLAGSWLVGISVMVATLETAFWHYKRYQLPLMALMIPLSGWLAIALIQRFKRAWLFTGLIGLSLIYSLYTTLEFTRLYRNNIDVTTHFQYAIATWIDTHVPAEARVGVFDVGTLRYVGQRKTYDVVGLTTPGVTRAMREGPGAVYDTLADHEFRPDYFALYPVHPATAYLMHTPAWGTELAHIFAPPVDNTTSAGIDMVIARADWSTYATAEALYAPLSLTYTASFRPLTTLNIGNVIAEDAASYRWHNPAPVDGYLTTIDALAYYGRADTADKIVDGTRAITGSEEFALPALDADEDYLIVLRVNARQPATLTFGCGDPLGTRVVPAIPGHWTEIAFLLPGAADRFCLHTDDTYYAARYWIYTGTYQPTLAEVDPIAQWKNAALTDYTLEQTGTTLTIDTTWTLTDQPAGDDKLFVHLAAAPDQTPVTQWDSYLLQTVPLANFLPGRVEMPLTLSLADVPAGTYVLSLGFYDVNTGQRAAISTSYPDHDEQRLFLTDIIIP